MKVIDLKVKNNPVIWNTFKEGGWEKYHDLTTNSPEMEEVNEMTKNLNSNELMNKISKRMEKIKFKSFGKVKRKITSVTNDKDLRKLYEEKIKNDDDENTQLDEKINKKILEYQLKEYETKTPLSK